MPVVDIIHGPNLNLLGTRQPEIYGRDSLDNINGKIGALASRLGLETRFLQSNHEGDIIDRIHESGRTGDFIIINPGAYTHTSVAIRDALAAVTVPAVEVHLSNPEAREDFRRKSLIAEVVAGKVAGFGYDGYLMALRYAAKKLLKNNEADI